MKALLLISAAAALLAAAPSATAQLPADHQNLVVLNVAKVTVPNHLPGPCRVEGVVSEVIEGGAYRVGQPIWIDVPCTHHSALDFRPAPSVRMPRAGETNPPSAAVEFYGLDPALLRGSKIGAARLTDDGRLIWGATRGELGGITGYRMLDPPRATPAGETGRPL